MGVAGQGRGVGGAGESGRDGLVVAVRATTRREVGQWPDPVQCKPNQVGPLCVPCSACPPTMIWIRLPEAWGAFSASSSSRFCASGHASGSGCTVLHAFGVPATGPRANRDRSITLVGQRSSPVPVKTEETETESAEENVMLEPGVSLCSVGGHVARVAFLCLRPCFWERSLHYARDLRHFRPTLAMLLELLPWLSPFCTFCLLSTFCSNTQEEDDGRQDRLRESSNPVNAGFNGVCGLLAGCRRGRRP